MQEQNPASPEKPFDPSAYRSLGARDRLATVSWYLVATGIIALIFAALCLVLDRTGNRDFFSHRDFSLNPRVLGRGLLFFGILCYAAGRSITYWRRFSRRGRD
jgi:uncharacterized membrane protein